MNIDQSKLENIINDGTKIVARCPACKAEGNDTKGDHLVVYSNGAFSCIKFVNDTEHNKKIVALAGMKSKQYQQNHLEKEIQPVVKIKINPQSIKPSRLLKTHIFLKGDNSWQLQ